MEVTRENFSDFTALMQLTEALWWHGSVRGASILIGAGVSRGANFPSSDTRRPPLWSDLAEEMTIELYGSIDSNEAPSAPLRLAEEYRVAFDDIGMQSFIARQIPDASWQPGDVHRTLLDLPWVDVLTTNYDTLLERASVESNRDYECVRNERDLALARSPRIIKLHGSISDGANVVISEEDYRSYPTTHAPFVNTARQVFIENELCLLGFSGDDPNFLQWAGWVRDNLGGGARRIYLVGALNLPTVKRRMLEARNIIPIDFGPLISSSTGDHHAIANNLFLEFLSNGRPANPNDWVPISFQDYPHDDPKDWPKNFKDPDHAVRILKTSMEFWRNDRSTYPKWIVCPFDKRRMIRSGSDINANLKLALESLTGDEQREALLELAWRYNLSNQSLEHWMVNIIDEAWSSITLQHHEPTLVEPLVNLLLDHARNTNAKDRFETLCNQFVEQSVCSDIVAITAYQKCLYARDRLDFETVSDQVAFIDGEDPFWEIRRSALQYWIGNKDDARISFRSAVRELKNRFLRDPNSIPLRSRFSWAVTFTDFLQWGDEGEFQLEIERYNRFLLKEYEPKIEVRRVESEVNSKLKKSQEEQDIELKFEAGEYRDNRNTIRFVSGREPRAFDQIKWLSEVAGVPTIAENVNVVQTSMQNALALDFEPTSEWYLLVLATAPSYSKGVMDKYLSRIKVALLSQEAAEELMFKCQNAVEFWRQKAKSNEKFDHDAVSHIRRYIEALSRFATQANPENAIKFAKLAVNLGCDDNLNHWWLYEPIGNLLKRSFEAIPPDRRSKISGDLLRFPTHYEKSGNGPEPSWPDPAPYSYQSIKRNKAKNQFDERVRKWTKHLSKRGASSAEVAIRLLYLHEQKQLTKNQQHNFAYALWVKDKEASTGLPSGLRLLPHSFLIAPSPSQVNAHSRVYKETFAQGAKADPHSLVAAVTDKNRLIKPSSEDANRLFRNITKWRPKGTDEDSLSYALGAGTTNATNESMADVLGLVAIPNMKSRHLTKKKAKKVLKFYEETKLSGALCGLGYFFGKDKKINKKIVSTLKRGLNGHEYILVHSTTIGLERWLELQKIGKLNPIPKKLVEYVLLALERQRPAGMASLVYLVRQIIKANIFDKEQIERTCDCLEKLFDYSDYQNVESKDRIAVSISIVRAECVRLAKSITGLGFNHFGLDKWLSIAKDDPLPEVRFALKQ